MIDFSVDEVGLLFLYQEDYRSGTWVTRMLEAHSEVTISRVFTFLESDMLDIFTEGPADDMSEFATTELGFRFAVRQGDHYRIPGRVLGIDNDVLLPVEGLKIERKLFAAERNISIFRQLARVTGAAGDIVIGHNPDGSAEGAIPVAVFKQLLDKFPKTTELNLYARARIVSIIGDFFADMPDHRARYEAYLDRRSTLEPADFPRMDILLRTEIEKYRLIRDTIVTWLAEETVRCEREWQAMILEFILLIFPKYIAVLQNVRIEDHYSRSDKVTRRFIDIALVDANGHIDVIEIKRPFDDLLLTKTKYRGNYVPTNELSGTIMQAEKYLFHLSKWGVDGEKALTARFANQLPAGLKLRITNPRAMAILGRDSRPDGTSALDAEQAFDFELIKRKYAKFMDIITYDDLVLRLDRLIEALRRRLDNPLEDWTGPLQVQGDVGGGPADAEEGT